MCIVPCFPKTLLNYDDALHRNIQSLRREGFQRESRSRFHNSLLTHTNNQHGHHFSSPHMYLPMRPPRVVNRSAGQYFRKIVGCDTL